VIKSKALTAIKNSQQSNAFPSNLTVTFQTLKVKSLVAKHKIKKENFSIYDFECKYSDRQK
jgi:hypothetical protein